MTNSIFGTDGIRGRANEKPLDPESLVRLGKAIAKHFLVDSQRHTILIGKDTRLSGYMIEYALASGLTAAGANVYLTGPIPTAGVAYLTKSMRVDAGIMVSASHNPYEDNGIKIFGEDGYKLPDEKEREIEELFESDLKKTINVKPQSIGKIKRIDDALGRYLVSLKSFFPRQLSLKGMKIGVDCANGASYQVAPMLFDELGADVVARGVSPSGKNINSGFGSLYPEIISKLVIEQNLDVGFSFDGDSDRIIVSDNKGNILDGDQLLVLFAKYYQAKEKLSGNAIVATVMSNIGVDNYLKDYGISVIRSKVGDRYVLEELKKNNLSLGGEQSGHIIFLDSSTCGDGILSGLKLLEIILESGKSLNQLLSDFHLFPQKLINLKVDKKVPFAEIAGYENLYKKIEKELLGKGRLLVRYSGTENLVRILVEAEEAKLCEQYCSELSDFLIKNLGKN